MRHCARPRAYQSGSRPRRGRCSLALAACRRLCLVPLRLFLRWLDMQHAGRRELALGERAAVELLDRGQSRMEIAGNSGERAEGTASGTAPGPQAIAAE